ncbi:MAG: NAD(P)-dependent oxidoreductase [Clostridia bacterium]|nr:NAD(P)-dependent oxidoreductase [Clostridia bacterium]
MTQELLKNGYQTKKVFIVGGTGMLGKSTTRTLVEKGYKVTSISLPSSQPKDLFDGKVEYILKDVNNITDTEMLRIMKEKDYMIIALGADERYTPKAPAINFFRQYNVTYAMNLLRLARLAKIKKVIILGSYFTYFNRIWPELKLKETHPYIRSRVEQMELAFTFNSSVMEVIILELPYVFGTVPKQTPLLSIVIDQLNSNKHIYYPVGGTAMATEKEVAEAIEGAILYGTGGKAYPVASINLKWKDFLSYLLRLQNQEHKVLTPYSNFATRREMIKKTNRYAREGRESGLDLVEYLEFQKRDAFIDTAECMTNLKYNPDDLKEAIKKTLVACQTQIKKLK